MALVLLHSFVEILYIIMYSGGIERIKVTCHLESPTIPVSLFPPSHVTLCTGFLRTDIGEELLIGSLSVDTYAHAFLPVTVVLHGATTVVLALIERVGELGHETEAQHVRLLYPFLCLEIFLNGEFAVGILQ